MLLLLMMMMMMMMLVYSEEDILSQYRSLQGTSRGSAIIRSFFSFLPHLSLALSSDHLPVQ